MSADTPRRLGRGLEALISTARQQREPVEQASTREVTPGTELRTVRIADVHPNDFQPRRVFNESDLVELESSLKTNGLLQPITVRARKSGGWELVAGERRLRAATQLGWTELPALIRDFDDRAMLTLALVENLQRADLNALEEAEGYQRLISDFGLTQQQVADAVGKDRTTITNLMRLLTLPVKVREMVEEGHLSASHARALMAVRDERQMLELAREIVAKQLSVRDVEQRARELGSNASAGKSVKNPKPDVKPPAPSPDPAVRRIEDQLRKHLQTDVSIQQSGRDAGNVRIAFYSADDLERVLDMLLGRARSDFD